MPRFSEMTSRERWEAALNRRKPDRLPMSYRATEEFTEALLRHTGCPDLDAFCERHHIDNGTWVGPRYTGPARPDDTDIYGCRYTLLSYGAGQYSNCTHNPLAGYDTVEAIEANYEWPDPNLYDYSRIADTAKAKSDAGRMICGGGWEPFLQYKRLRGEEQGYIDMVDNPGLCHYIMGKLFDFAYDQTRRTLEAAGGLVLLTSSSEDLGAQIGLLCSKEHIREFFLPLHKKMIAMQHSFGAKVMWHTDGAARDIIPDLIETGVDVLDPVQWRCPGMEREGLMRDFGKRLTFHGGIDNQYTLPFGTAEEVREEVRENFRIFGAYGGYVMGPCHNFQPIGPPENAVAMYETGYNECRY
jgi:uroporphyrinogen decarboxylase